MTFNLGGLKLVTHSIEISDSSFWFDALTLKFSSKCRTEKLEMIYTNLRSFFLLLNWEGADIQT